jgi:hypothetical protein
MIINTEIRTHCSSQDGTPHVRATQHGFVQYGIGPGATAK